MLRLAAFGVAALVAIASPAVHAQTTGVAPSDRLTGSEIEKLTDARIKIVKATLQLTPDQEKLWPAVEAAIRARGKDRQVRLAKAEERAEQRRDRTGDRDPMEFLDRRADALAQRAADLKNLAAAWGPLYKTLSQEQRQRLGLLGIFVLRDLRNHVEQRRLETLDDDDD